MADVYAQVTGWQIVAAVAVVLAAGAGYGEIRAALARHTAPLRLREEVATLRGCVKWHQRRDLERLREIADIKGRLGDAQGGAAVIVQALAARSAQEEEAKRG